MRNEKFDEPTTTWYLIALYTNIVKSTMLFLYYNAKLIADSDFVDFMNAVVAASILNNTKYKPYHGLCYTSRGSALCWSSIIEWLAKTDTVAPVKQTDCNLMSLCNIGA